jgi:hypothetical protein
MRRSQISSNGANHAFERTRCRPRCFSFTALRSRVGAGAPLNATVGRTSCFMALVMCEDRYFANWER